MKLKLIGLTLIMAAFLSSCEPPESEDITLTIGEKKNLAELFPANLADADITWTSSDLEVVSVTEDGVITALKFTGGGSDLFLKGAAAGTAVITGTAGDLSHSVTINTTMAGTVGIMDLPPLKDQFSDYFLIGNVFSSGDASLSTGLNKQLAHHYNALTAENDMKPVNLTQSKGSYNFNTADRMVDIALEYGVKVVGHTLLWHSQIPQWQRALASADRETALAAMKEYITDVVTHFKGRVYSWDVLNEVFPDGVSSGMDWTKSMRGSGAGSDNQNSNPWYAAIGSDFVYEGFLAARLADPDAVLYYNDYNLNQAGKAAMVRDMVRDVNAKYKQAYPNETRLLIEGIGMQSHHNITVLPSNIKRSIDLFRELGVKLSVSELDIIGQSWGEFSGSAGQGAGRYDRSTVTNRGLAEQARLYGEYMKLYIENSDIIERVSIWGLTDSKSWRSGGMPTLFDLLGNAKPAYYEFVGALEK